ncbi:hypothetical protein LWI28_013879 [Acer negundo]|uniref:Legume lectin domain-containing protein n=1 Tax=Acer negundo TaxID=4023 RepID=A0AAD5JNE5_ACENE|nr:hypothetical protein LWI28_013879 [Acer negundo]
MDVNDLKPLGFHKKKSILCFLCFVFHFPSLYAISFNYSNFSNNTGIKTGGNASFTSDGILSLTDNRADSSNEHSVGRAVYAEDMHLWDAGTGQIADFTTHFSFNISLLRPVSVTGDGLAFFLSPKGSQVPEHAAGGCLALITNCSDFKEPKNPMIVAVEFDTFLNDGWDPSDDHVGININSIQSVTNLTWDTSMKTGSRANAWISYNSRTSNLSLFLTYLDNPVFLGNSSLSYEVNLSKVLPEWVSVGFSSATGTSVEVHYILSWEFNSTELISGQGEDAIPPTSNNGNKAQGGANIGVVIGPVVGGLVLVGGFISTLVFCLRKRSRKAEDQESTVEADDHSIDNEFEHGMGPKRFGYGEVARSTNNFSEEGKLGEGGNVESQISLVTWVWEAYGNGRLVDVADEKLSKDFDLSELECLMMVGLWCAHPDHNLRPFMRQALQVLNFELALPNLPQQMPVPRFDLPTSSTSSTGPY